MLAELHAIEEAILSAPGNVNVCVATDSLAAIKSIHNWHSWSEGRQRKFVGEAVVRRIHRHTQDIASNGRSVSYQHLYSHIQEKKRKARANGPVVIAKLKNKLRAMKDRLWGPHARWIEGNEGADLLAGDAHCSAPTQAPWTMGSEGRAVVLFDDKGREVTGNIRRMVAVAEAGKWPDRMRRKPVRGRVLRDKLTDYRATHTALDANRSRDTGRMANFLHKARYGALPVRAVAHHHYWRRSTSGSLPVPPPPTLRTDSSKLAKWYARQVVYSSQLCPLCNADKETNSHPFSAECPANTAIATDTATKVQSLILAASTVPDSIATDIPLWFHAGTAVHDTAPCAFEPFAELRTYNREMGSLGYVPSALFKALDYYGVQHKDALVAEIATTIAKGAHCTWANRCKEMVNSAIWARAQLSAIERVEAGE
jgi:hypothetical protein